MAGTDTTILNYSGLIYAKSDERTPFLDAIYSRGKNGGRRVENNIEFILANSYQLDEPSQPNISETQAKIAPESVTIGREQESNVTQIFQRSVGVTWSQLSNVNALDGVNLANAQNSIPNEAQEQINKQALQTKLDLNFTLINGVWQYSEHNPNVARKTRGLIEAIQTNQYDASTMGDGSVSPDLLDAAIVDAQQNGFDMSNVELWVNPKQMRRITALYTALPSETRNLSRTEAGSAIRTIMTDFGDIAVFYDGRIPENVALIVKINELAVVEKPYAGTVAQGVTSLGNALVATPLALTGAEDKVMLYGELGLDYGAEWHHIALKNLTTSV